jgi:hypothetical protein
LEALGATPLKTCESRAGSRGAESEREFAVNGNNVVNAVGRDVRVAAYVLGVVIAVGAVGWRVFSVVGYYCGLLVVGYREDVREVAAGEDNSL